MISWYVPEASTFAADVDHLVLLVAVIVGVWFLLAEIVFFALIFKFRARDGRRSQYVTGEQKHEKRWISYPHYAVLVFDVGAAPPPLLTGGIFAPELSSGAADVIVGGGSSLVAMDDAAVALDADPPPPRSSDVVAVVFDLPLSARPMPAPTKRRSASAPRPMTIGGGPFFAGVPWCAGPAGTTAGAGAPPYAGGAP